MKIAFIGTHGVGKTGLAWSLAGYLKKAGFSVEMLPEAARIIADAGQKINENSTEEAQSMILKKQINLEDQYSLKHDVIICDRSVIDNFIYLLRVLKNKKLKKSEFGRKIKYYETMVKNHLKGASYDFIFYVPIVNKKIIAKDHYRSKNVKFRDEIESLLKDYLKTSRILLLANNKTRFIALSKKDPNGWNRIVRESVKL